MNDLVEQKKPLTYEEQFRVAEDWIRLAVKQPVIQLEKFKNAREFQARLTERIKRQKEDEKKGK